MAPAPSVVPIPTAPTATPAAAAVICVFAAVGSFAPTASPEQRPVVLQAKPAVDASTSAAREIAMESTAVTTAAAGSAGPVTSPPARCVLTATVSPGRNATHATHRARDLTNCYLGGVRCRWNKHVFKKPLGRLRRFRRNQRACAENFPRLRRKRSHRGRCLDPARQLGSVLAGWARSTVNFQPWPFPTKESRPLSVGRRRSVCDRVEINLGTVARSRTNPDLF